MIRPVAFAALVALVVVLSSAPSASAHYTPAAGDGFHYHETVVLSDGMGTYTGYTENSAIDGNIAINSVLPNGTENASYQSTDAYQNSTGSSSTSSSQGSFTFSAATFLYVQGTDNQTGYTRPYVWFFIDDSQLAGSAFTILNTRVDIVSTNASFAHSGGTTGYVRTIFAEGNNSFQRNDAYGSFTATFNWKFYFDPSTGYIVGYVYSEQDRDGSGNGFTLTDSLSVTSTTYPLAAAAAPPPTAGLPSGLLLGVAAVAVLLIVVLLVVLVVRRSRTGGTVSQHGNQGTIPYTGAPAYAPPPPLQFPSSGQPAVQQIVIKQTVKTNCRYCGALIDTTAEVCPSCGARRS